MLRLALLLLCSSFLVASVLLPTNPARALDFSEVTAELGIDALQHLPPADPFACVFAPCEHDRMTGGVAAGDIDGDGDLDLYFTRLDAPDRLFRNDGASGFTDVTAAAGLAAFDLQSNGAVFADVDNDGDADLYVVTLGAVGDPVNHRNYLFVNAGDGSFTEEASARGAAVADLSAARTAWSVAAGDVDRDGWIDLHVVEWLGGGPHAVLLKNRGAAEPGVFDDATADAGLLAAQASFGFGTGFVDFDRDGWQDLAIAGDFGTSLLFWNDGDGSFSEGTVAAGVGTDENGMGSAVGDFDRDGDLDWFVTSIHDPDETCEVENCNWGYTGNRLFRYEGGRVFSDATDAAGVREGFWGWGAAFGDFDNDGDLDLGMTNGVSFPTIEIDAPFEEDPLRLWENDGTGTYSEVSQAAGVEHVASGKAFLPLDWDDDGDLDLIVVNNAAQPSFFRNDNATGNDWLVVEVEGRRTNRDGRGAQVEVLGAAAGTLYGEIGADTHFLSGAPPRLHFGLGAGSGAPVSLRITLPASGRVFVVNEVAPNQRFVFHEPGPAPACGLLGVEAAALFVGLGWLRRRAVQRRCASVAPSLPAGS